MSEWQPIETAPQDEYILATDLYKIRIAAWDCWNRVWKADGRDEDEKITFYPTQWMPLPAPAQDDK